MTHSRLLHFPMLILLLAAAASLLAACGFHLRGAVPLSPSMERIYIQGGSDMLARDLRLSLQAAGAEIADQPQGARSVLQILDERIERRVHSVGGNARVQEYELVHGVQFALVRQDGVALLPPQQVTVTRDYRFDPDRVLGSSSEEGLLREEMQRDLAQLMLRRLAYVAEPEPSAPAEGQ